MCNQNAKFQTFHEHRRWSIKVRSVQEPSTWSEAVSWSQTPPWGGPHNVQTCTLSCLSISICLWGSGCWDLKPQATPGTSPAAHTALNWEVNQKTSSGCLCVIILVHPAILSPRQSKRPLGAEFDMCYRFCSSQQYLQNSTAPIGRSHWVTNKRVEIWGVICFALLLETSNIISMVKCNTIGFTKKDTQHITVKAIPKMLSLQQWATL